MLMLMLWEVSHPLVSWVTMLRSGLASHGITSVLLSFTHWKY